MGPRLILIILLSIARVSLFAADGHVAPNGSDTAPGTKDKPLLSLEVAGDGFVLPGPSGQLRGHFVGSPQTGFDLVFERNEDGRWKAAAGFVPGQVWTVCTDWKDSWYGQPQHTKIQNVEAIGRGQARGTATAVVGSQKWNFADVYTIQDDFVRIERTFEHADAGSQTKISLINRVRMVRGDDLRMLVPGSLYNGNPGSTMLGPSLSYEPGSIGLYEEHRLPIPMVNVESQVAGRRLHGSLLAQPGKIPQGHKGDDHWWSLGLEFGQAYVDLLSVSGAVATNGKQSRIYGHRNGLDVYDDAWLDVRGAVIFRKTLYLDLGTAMAAGDSFRHMLWKAFEVFRPIDTPHLPFDQAMILKLDYAKGTFYRDEQGAAGYCQWPWPNRYFQYGWCGGGEAIAYAMLAESARTGDEQARRQAIEAVNFFVRGAWAGSKGLCFGDYDAGQHRWLPAGFHGSSPGVSSRQFGEVLDRLGDLVLLGRKLKLDVKPWEDAFRKGCDFLVASPCCRGLYPRAWNIDGTPLGWQTGKEPVLSAAGASCIWPLLKMAKISGEQKYLDRAVEVMEAYAKQFGPQSPMPPWGATLDAGGEDKEAGWELMHAALDVYEANTNKRFLDLAQWAADWTLTWMYFHDIGLRKDSVLYGHLHTIGWTLVSTQNQEIDVFAYWMAPDYYRLGSLLHDPRYQQIAKVMYDACTQTIARSGRMFGQSALGIQAEHYNHTNCTYVGGQPETWRSTQHAAGISWVTAGGLYGGMKLVEMAPEEFRLSAASEESPLPTSRRKGILWRYTFGKPPDGWLAADFDDSRWKEGRGGFGEYGTPGGVVGTLWKTPDIWLRRSFSLGTKNLSHPHLLIHHDDDAEVYINGVLAARLTKYVTCYEAIEISPEATAALRPGKNVLALHCHQESGGQYIDAGIVERK
jgi:hypothetical protein